MRVITHSVAGDPCRINVPESGADLEGFRAFLARGDKVVAVDTEATGLDIYTPGHRVRLVQFGTARTAWVLDAARFGNDIRRALRQPRAFVMHNATFDMLAIDHHFGVKVEELSGRVFDTRILAHLLDPRGREDGGIGHGLKNLSTVYVDPDALDTTDGLTAVFRSLGLTKATGWAGIPLDNETYLRYSGLDVIYTARLLAEIGPMVRDVGLDGLSAFEHHLAECLMILQRRGMLLDVPYVEQLKADLVGDAEASRSIAARYGVANVNSTAQVAAALEAMGETLTETTPSGALKVDKGVLLPLADLDMRWERIGARTPNPLAVSVLHAKRSEKWAETYAQAFLSLRDGSDRLHPSINSLQARTARMSVSRPPLQQLPSGDWKVRRSFVADPGQLIVSSDFQAVEMRVLAALADVKALKEAFTRGEDVHSFTARMVEGDGFTPYHRKLYKGVGFGKVYGGGAVTLARQTGAAIDDVRRAIRAYDQTMPEIAAYSKRLQRRAEYGKKEVITPAGRHLPLDRDRLYAATNYVVQSTARDLLAQALVDCFAAGLGDHLLLPVHDEIVAQAPEADAEDFARELGTVMGRDFYGVAIVAEPEVYGRSWGHGYGARD